MNLNDAAKVSPTAKALFSQIQDEIRQSEAEARDREVETAERARLERLAHINSLHDQTRAQLDIYEQARAQATDALLQAFRLQAQLPSGVAPRHPIQHLERVHLPPSVLGPFESLFPVFTSIQTALMSQRGR